MAVKISPEQAGPVLVEAGRKDNCLELSDQRNSPFSQLHDLRLVGWGRGVGRGWGILPQAVCGASRPANSEPPASPSASGRMNPTTPPPDGSAATPARLNFLDRLETRSIRPATTRDYDARRAAAAAIKRP